MGRGGWRWNAGRRGWHTKVEDLRSIDAKRWAREGILRAGRRGGYTWSDRDTGEVLASINYACGDEAVTLLYTLDGEPMEQRVAILRTACNFGGTRAWFGCPHCRRRVALLYVGGSGFACRRCYRLVYRSQSEGKVDRAWRVQQKLEARLGEDGERPKGMHRRTHGRLLERIGDCEIVRDAVLSSVLLRLGVAG